MNTAMAEILSQKTGDTELLKAVALFDALHSIHCSCGKADMHWTCKPIFWLAEWVHYPNYKSPMDVNVLDITRAARYAQSIMSSESCQNHETFSIMPSEYTIFEEIIQSDATQTLIKALM